METPDSLAHGPTHDQVWEDDDATGLVVVKDRDECGHEIGWRHGFVCALQAGHLDHGIPHHYFGGSR